MEGTGDGSVEPREWSSEKVSDHWELLNVFSLPEIKCGSLEWMTVFSSIYPSTTCKVCVDMLAFMIVCVNSHTQYRCACEHSGTLRQTTVVHSQRVGPESMTPYYSVDVRKGT
jgi:hypothetical protein